MRHAGLAYDGREVFLIGGIAATGYLDIVRRFTREQLAALPRRPPDEAIAKADAASKPWAPGPQLEAILHAWTGALARIRTIDIKLFLPIGWPIETWITRRK